VPTQLISLPYRLPRDGGPALWHLGALLTFKATSEQTAGRMWAKELLAPRGMATPVHLHSREDETFSVLDGEVSVYVGDQVVRAQTGDFLWTPREVPHAFCVASAHEMRPRALIGRPDAFDTVNTTRDPRSRSRSIVSAAGLMVNGRDISELLRLPFGSARR
jgi:quercetin dioxygenase-like cupin family protein